MLDDLNPIIVPLPDLVSTERFATRLSRSIVTPLTLAVSGSLGAGKTQFVRYLCVALGVPAEEVTSPTYVLVQRYTGMVTIYHLDFYRLKSLEEAWQLGIEEFFEMPVLTIIEWAEKFPECLPDRCLHLHFEQLPQSDARQVSIWSDVTSLVQSTRDCLND